MAIKSILELANEIQSLSEELNKINSDLINKDVEIVKLKSKLIELSNINSIANNIIDEITKDSILSSKLLQLVNLLANKKDLVFAPQDIMVLPNIVSALVRWETIENAKVYTVHLKKPNGEVVRLKTFNNGVTIPNLEEDTNYEVSITSTNQNGLESSFSKSTLFKTNKNS